MLTFTSGQMQLFDDRLVDRFVDRAAAQFVAADLAGARALDLPALRRRVRHGVLRGRRFGLAAEADLMAFAALVLAYGPEFDAHPAVNAVLTDPRIPEAGRIAALRQRLAARHWEELQILADADLWTRLPAAGAA